MLRLFRSMMFYYSERRV